MFVVSGPILHGTMARDTARTSMTLFNTAAVPGIVVPLYDLLILCRQRDAQFITSSWYCL